MVHSRAGLGLYGADLSSADMYYSGDIMGVNRPGDALIDGDYMYVTQLWNTDDLSITTVDISDPENVFIAKYLALDFQPSQIFKLDYFGLILCTPGSSFWTVSNVDPVNVSLLVETPVPNGIMGTTVSSNLLYVGTYSSEIEVYSFGLWPTPTKENTVSAPSNVQLMRVNGNALYCTWGSDLYVFSLVDPENPTLADTFVAPEWLTNYAIQGDYLYAVTSSSLQVIDISDPLNFVPVSSLPLSPVWMADCITVQGQFAWIGFNGASTYLYRIWPPENPVELGEFYAPPGPALSAVWKILIQGDYYYDISFPYGLQIMDMYP
jgi:hypothetical protein